MALEQTSQSNALRDAAKSSDLLAPNGERFEQSVGCSRSQRPMLRSSFTKDLEVLRRMKPIFENDAEMRERIRSSMSVHSRNDLDALHDFGHSQAVVKSRWFEAVALLLIVLNGIWIGIETDKNPGDMLLTSPPLFQVVEHLFCIWFAYEWTIRFLAYRSKLAGFMNPWFLFDTVLVALMLVETWLFPIILVVSGSSSGGKLRNSSILRLARLLRLTRMARVARLLRAFPEVLIMIKGLVAAMRSVCCTFGLMLSFIYVLGIALKQVTAGTPVQALHFSTVSHAMYSLVLHATLLDSPAKVLAEIGDDNPLGQALFFAVILFSSLLLLNMLIGVLCEVVSTVSAAEKERISCACVKEKVVEILSQGDWDADGDGLISKDELSQLLNNEKATKLLGQAGVDVVGLIDYAHVIFQSDAHGQEYANLLSFSEFMSLVLQLRCSNPVTMQEIVDLRKFLNTRQNESNNQVARLEDRLRRMELRLNDISCERLRWQQNRSEATLDSELSCKIPEVKLKEYISALEESCSQMFDRLLPLQSALEQGKCNDGCAHGTTGARSMPDVSSEQSEMPTSIQSSPAVCNQESSGPLQRLRLPHEVEPPQAHGDFEQPDCLSAPPLPHPWMPMSQPHPPGLCPSLCQESPGLPGSTC